MYNKYFGITKTPFSIAPDPRFLYLSKKHREALAHLIYGIKNPGGFVLLTGEVGAGKTTICRSLIAKVPPGCDIAFIINPKLTAQELLETICDELAINYEKNKPSIKVLVDAINRHLLEAHANGRRTIVVIDEAQNLSAAVLEQLRLLTNLETNLVKLLQIILIGQPELRDLLAKPELRQLSQRITARYHLAPLSEKEVGAYINHRLKVAGVSEKIFPNSVVKRIYRLTDGIPRLINMTCDRAMLGLFSLNRRQVNRRIVNNAAKEVLGSRSSRGFDFKVPATLLAALGLAAAVAYPLISGSNNGIQTTNVFDLFAENNTVSGADLSLKDSLLQWPADQAIAHSEARSFETLFNEWGVLYRAIQDGDACQFANRHGLACLEKQGSLEELRQLNRPVVLNLRNHRGQEFHSTLKVIDDQMATVIVADLVEVVSLNELSKLWGGRYKTLWKPPRDYLGTVYPGHEGPVVSWIETKLAQSAGRPVIRREHRTYDQALVEQVKQFQRENGLQADGIVGALTVMHFNATEESVPLLTSSP